MEKHRRNTPPNNAMEDFEEYANHYEAANAFDHPPTTPESDKAGEEATVLSHESADQSMSTIHSETGDEERDQTRQELDNVALKISSPPDQDQQGKPSTAPSDTTHRQSGWDAIQASRNSMLTELDRAEQTENRLWEEKYSEEINAPTTQTPRATNIETDTDNQQNDWNVIGSGKRKAKGSPAQPTTTEIRKSTKDKNPAKKQLLLTEKQNSSARASASGGAGQE
jgi:hypothetical protein